MPFETSTARLWRALARADRLTAASAFWSRPSEEGAKLAAREIVQLLRVRPQALGRVALDQRVRALAGSPPARGPGRRPPARPPRRRAARAARRFPRRRRHSHEEGLIAEDAELPALDRDAAGRALAALRAKGHAPAAIRVYWNALWLQDRERWAALAELADELG